jgi:hypothetical protein
MSDELNTLLKQVYYRYKDEINSPVPIELIKKYLQLEGFDVD